MLTSWSLIVLLNAVGISQMIHQKLLIWLPQTLRMSAGLEMLVIVNWALN